jgi:putative Mg2+ transporter-C (MgtC) family protein
MNDFGIDTDALVRLLAAAGAGFVVGVEREATDQAAGLRTHIAVSLGAALFGVVSTLGFLAFEGPRAETNIQVDVTRVASQVVVGVGFLGAGIIFRQGTIVRNLTTAASLWVVSAIGLACGVGEVGLATVATVVLVVSLVLLRPVRAWIKRYRSERPVLRVELVLLQDAGPSRVLEAAGGGIALVEVHRSGGPCRVIADVVGGEGSPQVLADLASHADVAELRIR